MRKFLFSKDYTYIQLLAYLMCGLGIGNHNPILWVGGIVIYLLAMNYKTAREIMGLYETYVVVSGFSIDELAKHAYHNLTIWKKYFFSKEAGQYKQLRPKAEMKKLLSESL